MQYYYQSKEYMTDTVNLKTDFPSPHPGSILLGELSEHGLSQRELAVAIGKTPAVVNGIIKGDRDINSEIALLLEVALPGPTKAEDWMRMQCIYDLEKARRETDIVYRQNNITAWSAIKSTIKLSTVKKKLDFKDNIAENISMVYSALGVATLEEFYHKVEKISVKECFKKSEKVNTDPVNLLTWLIVVRHKSNAQALDKPFRKEQIPALKQQLNHIIYENTDTFARTERLCNDYGIKFIREAKLDKVPVDGYSFWMGDNPTIVMTGRMDRIDNFAFTLFHELGHIENHLIPNSEEDFIDIEPSNCLPTSDSREVEANSYATSSIWNDADIFEVFGNIENPFGAATSLKQIARQRRMNTGVVVGQYRHFCHEQQLVRNAYAICHNLIEKVN